VNNTNLHAVSHRFPVVTQLQSLTGVPFINALIPGNLCDDAVDHILLKTSFGALCFCHRQYGSIFDHFDIIGHKVAEFCKIMQNSTTTYIHQGQGLRSFNVTDFGAIRKPQCNLLLVISTSLRTISNCFKFTADYLSTFALNRGTNTC